ncbi:MAG: hypothetical protein ACREJR_01775 [Candidatus Rokuibacteriota bacterium]
MPREPITTTTIPAPPLLFPVLLRLGLGLVAFGVLFVLPPCASSPQLDVAVLAGLGLWAGMALVRCLRWSRRRRDSPLPRRGASTSARITAGPDERE